MQPDSTVTAEAEACEDVRVCGEAECKGAVDAARIERPDPRDDVIGPGRRRRDRAAHADRLAVDDSAQAPDGEPVGAELDPDSIRGGVDPDLGAIDPAGQVRIVSSDEHGLRGRRNDRTRNESNVPPFVGFESVRRGRLERSES